MPRESKRTTAILHLPSMRHRPAAATLREVLPCLVAWAASGLAHERRPSVKTLGDNAPRCLLVTEEHPEGEVVVAGDEPTSSWRL